MMMTTMESVSPKAKIVAKTPAEDRPDNDLPDEEVEIRPFPLPPPPPTAPVNMDLGIKSNS